MAASISMPHVMPGFLRLTRSYGILPSLRVSDVNLPVIGIFPPYGSLYAFGSAISVTLRNKLAAPEPPVIKVSSYESVVKKPVVCISSSDDQKAKKKRKPERPGKRSKSESEENLSEIGAKSTSDRKASEKGMSEQKEKSAISTKKLAEDKKNASVSSLEQIRSTASKAKKWSGTRRRSNSELTAAIKA